MLNLNLARIQLDSLEAYHTVDPSYVKTFREMYKELSLWHENVRYMLDNEPSAVRMHEGNNPQEDLLGSLCVTFIKLQKASK